MVQWQDCINGGFELLGAPFLFLSILKLHREKKVRGVSILPVLYFMIWGMWNLYYYPHLNQWTSFLGGMAITTINTIWAIQIMYYRRKEKR